MRRDVQAVLLTMFGAVILKLVLTDAYLNYVKEGLGPFLLLGAIALLILGVVTMLAARSGEEEAAKKDKKAAKAAHDHDGHDHGGGGPRVAWLLVLPLLAVAVIAPPALGSYAAARDTGSVDYANAGSSGITLPPGDGPVEMNMLEYGTLAVLEKGKGLGERPVELVGFVGADKEDHLVLTRMMLSCCAADGQAIKVYTDVPSGTFPKDTWVKVTGTYTDAIDKGQFTWPALKDVAVEETKKPHNPYL